MSVSWLAFLLTAIVASPAPAAVVVLESGRPATMAADVDPALGNLVLDLNEDAQSDVIFSVHFACVSNYPSDPFTFCIVSLEISPRQGLEFAYLGDDHLVAGAFVGAQIVQPTGIADVLLWMQMRVEISSQFQDHINPSENFYQKPVPPEVMDAYIAFRVPVQAESWRYGYLHFDYRTWPSTGTPLAAVTGDPILVGWAYETTPDTSIRVQSIPEPTLMLFGLTCLVAGARRGRVERQAAPLMKAVQSSRPPP